MSLRKRTREDQPKYKILSKTTPSAQITSEVSEESSGEFPLLKKSDIEDSSSNCHSYGQTTSSLSSISKMGKHRCVEAGGWRFSDNRKGGGNVELIGFANGAKTDLEFPL